MIKPVRFIVIICLIASVGCSPSLVKKDVLATYTDLASWPAFYRQNHENLKSLQSNARLTVESLELSSAFTVKHIFAAPDTLLIEAEGPFGIDLGKIFVGKKRFILYNQFHNQFIAGMLESDYYNTFLQTNLTFAEIKNAFIGYVPLPANLKLVDERHGVFAVLKNGKKWRFVVDVKSGLLQSWEIQENGQTTLKEEFKYYRVLDGIVFPALIRIIVPGKTQMVSIFHKDIVVNQKIDSKKYSIEIGPKVKQLMVAE